MMNWIRTQLVFMGLRKEDYFKVLEPVGEENMRAVRAWSIGTAVFWILSIAMSLNSPAYAACRNVYIGALAVSMITLAGTEVFEKPAPWLRNVLINLLVFSVLGAGIGIAICQPDVRTATMIAFAAIVPVCVINSTLDTITRHVITIIAYAVLAKNVIVPDIYSWGLTNLIIFSAAGLLVGHVINKTRFERFLYAQTLREIADMQTTLAYHDQLTGVGNRHAYGEKLEELDEKRPPHFCIIMADLNGLKQTNDSLGHEAGDELIIGAARCIEQAFGETGSIFRIGGDEFCIITEGVKADAERCALKLDQLTSAWKGKLVPGLSVCWGIAEGNERTDAESVVHEADQAMYLSKRNFYMRSGTDRRRR